MADLANPQIVDTISIENLKTIAGNSASVQAGLNTIVGSSMGMAVQNAVNAQQLAQLNAISAQQRVNVIAEAATVVEVNKLLNMDTEEANSILRTNTGNSSAETMTQLLAALNSGAQGVKAAANTPPVGVAPSPA